MNNMHVFREIPYYKKKFNSICMSLKKLVRFPDSVMFLKHLLANHERKLVKHPFSNHDTFLDVVAAVRLF